MIVSEALYNVHLCKVCQCFVPVWGGASSSQINIPGEHRSDLAQHVHIGKLHIVSAVTFLHIPIIHTIKLKSGKSMVGWHVLPVHTCSFICTNLTDMIAYTAAFLGVEEHSHHPDFHHGSRGWHAFFQTSLGEIGTQDLPLSKETCCTVHALYRFYFGLLFKVACSY